MAIVEAWLWTLGLNGPLGIGAYLVARHGFRQPAGWPRILASVVLGWTWATLGMEVLGPVGLLSRGPLLAWSASALLVGWSLRLRDRAGGVDGPGQEPETAWEASSTVALGFFLWGVLALGVNSFVMPVKVVSDGPIYHLYLAARWWKAGRISLVATPFGENAATYFPAVGDLWSAWLMVGWGGDRPSRVGQSPFLMAAMAASYALARRLGADRASAILATCWFASVTPLFIFSFEPNVDTIFIAGYLLAVFFFSRYALGDDGLPSLSIGGLAAGAALGTKSIGVVFVPPLLALAAFAAFLRGRSPRDRATALGLIALTPLALAGYWYGRNALLTGNPLYPLQVEAFGRVWLAGWYGPGAMKRSVFYLSPRDWRALADILLAILDPRLAPIWLAALAGAWRWGGAGVRWSGWIWGCSALSIANIALYWIFIPYRTEHRFMLHAMGLAAVPLAMTFRRSRALRWAGAVLLGVHVLSHQGWPMYGGRDSIPWDLSPVIPTLVTSPVVLPASLKEPRALVGSARAWVPLVADGWVAFALAWAWARAIRSPRRGTRARAIALSVAGVMGLGVVSWPFEVPARIGFYPYFPDQIRGWLAMDLQAGPAGARVAYAGTNLPYYLLGVGIRNEVRYVNVDEHRDWLLHDYHREARSRGLPNWPNARPGWDRIHPDYRAWLENLRAGRIRILYVTRAVAEEGIHNLADAQGFPIERQWADSHPETFQPIYGEAQRDEHVRVYAVRPPRP